MAGAASEHAAVAPCLFMRRGVHSGKGAHSIRVFTAVHDQLSTWVSYRWAVTLLPDLYLIDGGIAVATAQRCIGRTADTTPRGEGNNPISLPLDTIVVRGWNTDRYHGLEIPIGAVGQGSDPIQYFAVPISLKGTCIALGRAAIGGAPMDRVETFSDRDRFIRAMSQAIGINDKLISDWIHISMRVSHVLHVADAVDALTPSIVRTNEAIHAEQRSAICARPYGKATPMPSPGHSTRFSQT